MENHIQGKFTGKRVRVAHPFGAYEGSAKMDVYTVTAEQRADAQGNPHLVHTGLKEYIGTQITDDRGFMQFFQPHQVEEILT